MFIQYNYHKFLLFLETKKGLPTNRNEQDFKFINDSPLKKKSDYFTFTDEKREKKLKNTCFLLKPQEHHEYFFPEISSMWKGSLAATTGFPAHSTDAVESLNKCTYKRKRLR